MSKTVFKILKITEKKIGTDGDSNPQPFGFIFSMITRDCILDLLIINLNNILHLIDF
jgi:hypothetical protein